jgi:hypothetical protein
MRKYKAVRETELELLGLSRDLHTNVWKVLCKCGKDFKPETTMLCAQKVVCPRCKQEYVAYYNDEPPTIVELKGE